MELLLLPLLLPILWPSWLPGTQAKVDRCNETASEGPAEVEAMPSNSGTLLNVSISDQGRSDSLFLSWDEPEGDALGYSLALYTLDPDLLLQNGSAGPNATSFQFQGLVPGTRYRAEVTAALTCAAVIREVVTGQTSPSPVHNVSLSNRGSTSALHASWVDASGKKDGYRLVLYHLDSQVAVRNESVLADVSAFLFEGLLAGSEYALKITTRAGASQASTSLHQWTAPSAPEELRLQNLGSSTSLFASWTSAGGAAWLHLKLHSLLSSKVIKAISTKRGLTNYTFQHLDPGTQYHLAVSATAGTYMASGPNATAWTCPLSPTNVSLSSGGDNGSLQAQWSSPAGNRDFYLVTLQQDESKTPTRNVSVGGDSTSITFHSLSPGTQYTVQVTAMAGPYRASSQSAATWTQPVAPPGASLSSQGSPSTLHACWEEATGSGYKVELYTMEPHVLVLSSSVQRSITNLTYEGLSPGTQYTLVIRTIAGLHASPPLWITNWTYPLPPEELSLSNRGHSTSLYASWKGAPAVSIVHYRGVLFETKSQVQIRNVSLEKSWTNITFEGLSPGRQYTLEMAAVAGPYKSPMCTAMDWTYPLAPSGVTLTTKKHSFGLSAFWDKASGDRDQFLLQLYSREHPAQRNISVGPDTQNFTFLGLLPGTQYFLEVTARAGPYSASSQPATEWTYPLSLANVSVSQGQSPQELHVSWMESGGGRDHWVQLYADESLSIIRNVSVPRGVTHVDLDGLVPGARYRVEIISQAGPHRTSSQTAIGYTAPLMPLHPLVTNGGSTSALAVHWEAPAGQRDGYLVNVSEEGSSAAGRRVAAGKNSTSVTVVGLAPGSCYHIELWAVAGAYSSDLQNITGCTVPAAPMNVSLTNAGSSSVLHAAWAEPPGGRDYYRVILYNLASQTKERTESLGPGAENITWTHLAAGSKFAVQVTAVKGPYESSSPNITQWTYPLAPANLTLASPSAFTLQASWTGAEQGGEGYTMELYETSSGSLASQVSLGWGARNHTFWSLSPGTRYSVRVSAAAGPYHAIAPNLTHWTRPLAPPAVHLVNEGHPDRLSASWGAVAGSQNSYTLILCHAGSGTMVARTSLGKDAHNFTFEDLAPGHEYLLEVVSTAGPYWASAANVSNWTCPLAPLALRLVNEGHPDRLSASWEAAAGSRDSYMLTLYHAGSGTAVTRVSLGKDAHNFTFAGLAPGHGYILEAVSKAGPCLMPARNISDWTYPLPPLNVYVTNQGHPDRLTASWGAAAGERDGYLLTLYHAGSGSVAANASVGRDASKFTFSHLAPGHKYLLEVVSMAGPYVASAGNISDWTTPLVPADLSAVIGENRTLVSVSWGPSSSQQDYCQLWLREPGNSTLPRRHTLAPGQVQHVFWGLVPGRNYSVSLSCVAGPYWNSTGVLVVPVEPNPVKDVQCLPDSKAFYLNWTMPSGDVEAYELMVERPSRGALQPEIHMTIPGSEASLEGLVPNSSYQISLRVLGRNGMRSWAVTLLCNTSVEVLPPPVLADVLQFEAGSRVVISSDMFSEENGRIQYYGVIATTNESLLRPTQEIVTTTWYDHYYGQEDSYLAVLIPNPFHPSHRSAPQTWAVPVGTEECGHSRKTCNGKLKANIQYRFSIAAFTRYDQLDPAVSFTSFSAAGADATPFPIPIVAGVIAGFLLTLTAIFGLVYWKRARAKRHKKSNLPQEMSTYSLRNVHRPVPIQSFKQYYEMKTANANNAFFQEFEELKEVGKEQPKVEAELPANVSKNRHPHVLPYDHSRVRLSQLDGEPHSDYINANFVPGYTSQQEFIVTQGPLKKTIEDFWRMVWEQNVYNIVMLTVGMENGRVLCDHYWPSESAPVSYGQICVHLLTQSSSDEWTMREFKLWHEGLKVERHVTHLHYTAWPDHGIPESTTSIIAFRELVREHIQTAKDSGPTLVHCSAGVGRSGTFIALDRLLQQMKQEKVVDVFGTLYTMRMSRYQMIQTLVQYIFLHSCILDKIAEEPLVGLSGTEISCPIPVKSFMQHYTQKSAKSKAGFLREYEILLEVAKDEASSAAPSVGSQQSRPCSSFLAYDRARIKFSPLEQGPFSDVFQAWLIPGCNSARDYLAIQGPDKVTMEDFWSLVWECGVHTIVTLLSCPEKNQVPSEACWPLEGDPVCTEMLTIQRGTEKHISGWRCIQLKLKHEKKVKERQVQRFLYPLWGRKQQPDARALVEFLAAVRRHTPHKKRAGPLLLHCSSGVGQMGTLIALDCLLHQLKVERSVDVYGVTLRLIRSCCLMTPTLDQYMFLYMCIRDILAQRLP